MKKTTGHWFLLEESPSILMIEGPPKIGDPIRISLEENSSILRGRVSRMGSRTDSTDKYSLADEVGAEFIYSAGF